MNYLLSFIISIVGIIIWVLITLFTEKWYYKIFGAFVLGIALANIGYTGIELGKNYKTRLILPAENHLVATGKEITLNQSLEKFTFKAGEDFPAGRYIIESNNNEGAFFIRKQDRKKIVSDTFAKKEKISTPFVANLKEGMMVAVVNTKELHLKEVNKDTNKYLYNGIWFVGDDLDYKEGSYEVKNTGEVVTIISNEDGEDIYFIKDENKDVKLKNGYMIRVMGDGFSHFKKS